MVKTEKQTRKEIIDEKLLIAGWNIDNCNQVIKEFAVKKTAQTLYADYVLLGKDNYPLAVVEAKKTIINAESGKEQAFEYAQLISNNFNREIPIIFYTNGYDIFCWESEIAPPKKVFGFPTLEDLERKQFLIKNKINFTQLNINSEISGRPYQMQAIRSITEEIENAKSKFLLVMATGTGKTRTCVGLIDLLMRANSVQKVLFLVDRIALQEQAVEAFQEYLPHTTIWPQKNEKKLIYGRRIYVVTYPTLLNEIQKDECNYSPHYFDLIVADESHRSIYNTYRQIFNYFNAIQLGLTATPTDKIDHNTFELFSCEKGLPTFAYSFKEAVDNIPPYLSDFEVLKLRSLYQKDGINHETILDNQIDKLIAEGKNIDSINYDGSDIEKKVSNKGTNELIVKQFMDDCIKDPNGVLPGKTIMFCISKAHAYRMEEIFNTFYPEYKGRIAEVLVSEKKGVYGKGGILDRFKNSNFPRVAISVDMLDTGVDVREAVNLVFAKPVFSFTKFWQMIGRGSRILDPTKPKEWCTEKSKFLIIDCWDNFEYFKIKAKGKEIKIQIPVPVKLFNSRLNLLTTAISKNNENLIQNEKEKLQLLIKQLPKDSIIIKENEENLTKINSEKFWIQLDIEKIDFLSNSIAPILKGLSSCDFKAMRFENDVVNLSLNKINNHTEEAEFFEQKIIQNVSKLPMTINTVSEHKDIINSIIYENKLSKSSSLDLEEIISKISPLMKFRKKVTGEFEELDILDRLVTREYIEFGAEHEQLSVEKYRKLMESKINEMVRTEIVLQKINENKEVSDSEIQDLADKLETTNLGITESKLQKIYKNRNAKFIQFMRHILGIEPLLTTETIVSKAIDDFISEHFSFNTVQIQFMQVLKKFITDNHKITKRDFTNAPFTQIHPRGILGLFDKKQREEILTFIEKISA
jgi:type I restriction enzyme, R subunit